MTGNITIIPTKLSDLISGDKFKFKKGEKVYYKNASQFIEFEPSEHLEYIVLKKNSKSVKCIAVGGRIEFLFLFSGFVDGGRKPAPDVDIIICSN